MSGPKGFDAVVAARVRLARETEAARARCAALVERCEVAESTLSELTGAKQRTHRPAIGQLDLDAAQSLERELRTEVSRLEGQLHDVRVETVRRHLRAEFEELAGSGLELPALGEPAQSAPAPEAARKAHEARQRKLADRIGKALELMALVDEAPRGPLTEQANQIRDRLGRGDQQHAELLLLDLHTGIEHALRAQRERDSVRTQAADLLIRTAHIAGPEADGLRGRALACTTRQELRDVLALEQQLIAADEAAQNRAYIVAQTRRALRELGYELGEEFESAALSGASVVATRPDLLGYGLQWRFGPAPKQVFTNVVAFAPTDGQRDIEVEELTCGDVEKVRVVWSEHGVESGVIHQRAAGVVPVERIAAPAAASGSATSRSRSRQAAARAATTKDVP